MKPIPYTYPTNKPRWDVPVKQGPNWRLRYGEGEFKPYILFINAPTSDGIYNGTWAVKDFEYEPNDEEIQTLLVMARLER